MMRFSSHEMARLRLRAGVSPTGPGRGPPTAPPGYRTRPHETVLSEADIPGLGDASGAPAGRGRRHDHGSPPRRPPVDVAPDGRGDERMGYDSAARNSPSGRHLREGGGRGDASAAASARSPSTAAEVQADLRRQVEAKQRRLAAEKAEQERWERSKDAEADEFFMGARRNGRGGGGDPVRDGSGRGVADLKRLGRDLATTSPTARAPGHGSPGGRRGADGRADSRAAGGGRGGGVHWEGGAMAAALSGGGGGAEAQAWSPRRDPGRSPSDAGGKAAAAARYREELAEQVRAKKDREAAQRRRDDDVDTRREHRATGARQRGEEERGRRTGGFAPEDGPVGAYGRAGARRGDGGHDAGGVDPRGGDGGEYGRGGGAPARRLDEAFGDDGDVAAPEAGGRAAAVERELVQRLGQSLAAREALQEENDGLREDCAALQEKLGEAIDILEQYREQFGMLGDAKGGGAGRGGGSGGRGRGRGASVGGQQRARRPGGSADAAGRERRSRRAGPPRRAAPPGADEAPARWRG